MSEVTTSKKKNKKQRRFNDEQIKSLELIFESEPKLEPKKKLEVARELGMQPRQVAIWFQNKRARWKSKQLEHDYNILQANFNNLASKTESLKKEKQALVIQLEKLNDRLRKQKEEGGRVAAMNNIDKGDADKSGDGRAIKTCYLRNEKEHDLISMVEAADGSLTSTQDMISFDSAVLFDQSMDFWC